MMTPQVPYAARLDIDYPEKLDRFATLVRLIWVIPIAILLEPDHGDRERERGHRERPPRREHRRGSLRRLLATLLMIVFRARYPRWWFDFARELTRFGARVGATLACSPTSTPPPSRSRQSTSRSTTRMSSTA